MTLWPVSAAKVSGCTNLLRRAVITTCTSRPGAAGAHQLRRLVRGNSAGDAHGDSHGSIVEQVSIVKRASRNLWGRTNCAF
jgi:hypothetical protein